MHLRQTFTSTYEPHNFSRFKISFQQSRRLAANYYCIKFRVRTIQFRMHCDFVGAPWCEDTKWALDRSKNVFEMHLSPSRTFYHFQASILIAVVSDRCTNECVFAIACESLHIWKVNWSSSIDRIDNLILVLLKFYRNWLFSILFYKSCWNIVMNIILNARFLVLLFWNVIRW